MFLGYQNNNISFFVKEIPSSEFYVGVEWVETNDEYILVDGKYLIKSEADKELEKQRLEQIAMLKMTPLDFIKVLEELGLTWVNLKAIMTQYPDVEKELTMCQFVYRGNPLLNQMIPMVNKTFGLSITEQQLDLAFAKKNDREDLLGGGKG
jgi:hypothetical protein